MLLNTVCPSTFTFNDFLPFSKSHAYRDVREPLVDAEFDLDVGITPRIATQFFSGIADE
ncbi:MAG: hypothetical protein V4636_05960 [Pseudomonadota bacterium]